MTTREEAYDSGDKFYNTGVPCRRGHNSDRYTSSGNCVECSVITQNNQRIRNRSRTIQANLNRFKETDSYARRVPLDWHEVFDKLRDIALYADSKIKDDCRGFIDAMAAIPATYSNHAPESVFSVTLTTSDLRAIFKQDASGAIINLADFDQTVDIYPEDHTPCMYMNGHWYAAVDLKATLDGSQSAVNPTTPEPASLPATMKGIIK